MNVVRRILTIVLISGLVAAIVLGFLWFKLRFSSHIELRATVPEEFILCLETTNYDRLSSGLLNHSLLWKEFLNYNYVGTLDDHLHQIDSLKRAHPNLDHLFQNNVIMALYPAGDSLTTLFALDSPENNAKDQLLKLVSNETRITKEKYENVTLYNLEFTDNIPQRLSFFETRGVFILSPSHNLLKDAVLQVNNGENVFETGNYNDLIKTLGEDVEAHLFLNFDKLNILVSKLIREEKIPKTEQFASQAALDLELKPNQLILNGFSSYNDSTDRLLPLFKGQEAVTQKLFSFIPSTVSYLKWIGLSDPGIFLQKLEKKYSSAGQVAEFRQGFYEHFEGQAAEIVLKESNISFPHFLIVAVKSRGQAEAFLKENLPGLTGGNKIESRDIRIDGNINVEAYKFPVAGMEKLLFGDLMGKSGPEWYCFYENNLVLGNSPGDLKQFIYLNTLGKTLENDDYFMELKNNFSSRSNFLIFLDPSRYFSEAVKLLKREVAEAANLNRDSWKKINAVAFQSTVTENMNYLRLFVNYTGQIREFVNTVWERKLEANLTIKPAIVLNHINGEKEIFVQDELNNIYLISNNGSILWKQKTDGKILSEIFQMDYYRNGKLQYLFNTENRIYLLDRNGNNVENFPVEIRQKASAGISLFDYEKNGNYRIPVPTVDRDILMYDRDGRLVSGWRFRKADHVIKFPMEHYRLGSSDYLIARDDFRLYIADRRGRLRISPNDQIDFSLNNPVYFSSYAGSRGAGLVASDREGKVYAFYFDGKTEKLLDTKMGEGHYFLPADLNGDRENEYVFIDSTALTVYDHDGETLFSEIYPGSIYTLPVVYSFSTVDKKIGVVIEESERIYLVNNDGSLYKGFPLKGSSLFSISSFPGLKGRFNLIVGNNDNFLYNYSVK